MMVPTDVEKGGRQRAEVAGREKSPRRAQYQHAGPTGAASQSVLVLESTVVGAG